MAVGITYSWPWPLSKICLRNPAFQNPAMTCDRNAVKVSSSIGMVPGIPIWWNGCEPYQIGCATVQPVFFATASAIRVTRKVSSP